MGRNFYITLALVCITNLTRGQNFNTDSLLGVLANAKEDTNKVNLYRNLGVSLAHQDPQKAIGWWKQGVELGKRLNYDVGLARCYINIATGYSFFGRFDIANVYSDTAIYYSHKVGSPDRLALAYLNRADLYRNLQDFRKTLLYCDTALRYAEKTTNIDRMARIYGIISGVYIEQKQYGPGLTYMNKSLDLYRKDGNTLMVGQTYSDFADVYKETNQHGKAIEFYKMAIHIADSVQDLKNLSSYYYALCDLYIHQGKYNEAENFAAKSIEYAKQQGNDVQLGTAYSLLCNLYIKRKKFDEAVTVGLKSYQYAVTANNLFWQEETASLLSAAYDGTQDHKNAYKFLGISKNLNDSIIRQNFDKETVNLQSSFELKQKDKEIQLLNKDKELKSAQLIKQRSFLIASIALAILVIMGTTLLVNRNRLRQRMKELELRNRIAADLHDEVGSSLSSIYMLSQIATESDSSGFSSKDIMLKVSNNAYETMEKMSDIVWMVKPDDHDGLSLKTRMERYIYELCAAQNIECNFCGDELEHLKLSMEQRKNLYLIFKEALNNSVKYSGTTKLDIVVAMKNNHFTMHIKDYGKGFDEKVIVRGNGLENMQNRAKELKGNLKVSSGTEKGTELHLRFPV